MVLPNFLVIGAAKSGTTSLYRYLSQHPQVYLNQTIKEAKFFSLEGKSKNYFNGPRADRHVKSTTFEHYCSLFEQVQNEQAIGEVSPLYLYDEFTASKIKHYIPDVKIIVILRNPVERAYSAYSYMLATRREELLKFELGLKAEPERIKHNWFGPLWHYKKAGFYFSQLERYYKLFDAKQIAVYLYEDLCRDPQSLMERIFDFLEVDSSFKVNTSDKHNKTVGSIPKNKFIHLFVKNSQGFRKALRPLLPDWVQLPDWVNKNLSYLNHLNLEKPDFSEQIRLELIEEYREDILKLEDLIKRDLSSWLR